MSEEAAILVDVVGAREATAALGGVGAAATGVAKDVNTVGVAAERTARRGFMLNQMLFTMRRFLYLTTLGVVALGVSTLKWGYDYNSQMQQGQIALGQFMGSNRAAKRELDKLFLFTAYTPFQFKDVVSSASMLMRFNISAATTNRILRNVTDALAGTTKATPGGLNRIATALGHMMSMGHATGQVLLQLARDGIPGVYDAVKKYFGLSDTQMHHIGTLGLPATDVMTAINQYIEHSHLHGLARREALGSLHGLLTTSRDFISRIMGTAEQPGFSWMQRHIAHMNVSLQRAGTAIQHGKPVLPALFGVHPGAFGRDVELIINLLHQLWRVLTQSIIPAFRVWLQIFQPLKLLLLLLTSVLGVMAAHTTLLKYAMILLFFAMTPKWAIDFWGTMVLRVTKLRRETALFWTASQLMWLNIKTYAKNAALFGVRLYEIWVLRAEYATVIWAGTVEFFNGVAATMYLRLLYVQDALKALVFWTQFQALLALEALSGMMETVAISAMIMWDALLGPVGIILLVIGLFALLYLKWKPFHDIVNETISFIWNHPLVGLFVPVIGPFVVLARLTLEVYNNVRRLYDLLRHPLRGLEGLVGMGRGGGGAGGFLNNARNIFSNITGIPTHLPHWPHLAGGGSVIGGGWSWVGEHGPELSYMPRGSVVLPAQVAPIVWGRGGFDQPHDQRPIQVQLIADGKVLAEVVATHRDDVRARS